MTEKRCGLCRHWTRSEVQTDVGNCAADPDWPGMPTGDDCGAVCPRFEARRLTPADIRNRWPELWEAVTGYLPQREPFLSRARTQLFEALRVEEE